MSNIAEIKNSKEIEFYLVQALVPSDVLMEVLNAIHKQKVTPHYWQVNRP